MRAVSEQGQRYPTAAIVALMRCGHKQDCRRGFWVLRIVPPVQARGPEVDSLVRHSSSHAIPKSCKLQLST